VVVSYSGLRGRKTKESGARLTPDLTLVRKLLKCFANVRRENTEFEGFNQYCVVSSIMIRRVVIQIINKYYFETGCPESDEAGSFGSSTLPETFTL